MTEFYEGQRVLTKVVTVGDDPYGNEQTYPAGSAGVIDLIDESGIHVQIGDPPMIVNVLDPDEIEPAPKQKFKVCFQQYVETLATMEVEADDEDEARRLAEERFTSQCAKLNWIDGDDAYKAEVYAVLNEKDETVWER